MIFGGRLQPVLGGGRYFEAPRWQAGRLWLVDAAARTLIVVSPEGAASIACHLKGTPAGLGFLPDGTPVVTDMHGRALVRCDGSEPSVHADLSALTGTIDDMVTDGSGRAFVGDLGFDLKTGIARGPFGRLVLVQPGAAPRIVAEGLDFPNGIALSPDGRLLVVAETNGDCLARFAVRDDGGLDLLGRVGSIRAPDGVCLDQEGAAWVSLLDESAFVRLAPDGRVLDRIAVPGWRGVACVLGGEDRRTLFCISMRNDPEASAERRTQSRLDAAIVEVPGAGYP
ncbi:SMP-30/gluconolactonase/LRE family protein [Reyranella sp.]|uniref:SMP-30/gluconolactonase/LRE family protein n=1 Tax=Reyranella sp. TaxID=1929291 RepID=UPI003BA8BB0A